MCDLQALQVLETLIIKGSDKLDIRDKQAVSQIGLCPPNSTS